MKTQLHKHQIITIGIFVVFIIIFILISLVNHYQLRTYAFDLGVSNHALYGFAHLKSPIFTLGLDGREMPFLATHFSLITALYSPLYYLFGSYSLLILQIVSIGYGALGVYKYAQQRLESPSVLPAVVFHFFAIWGIYSALAFDFHDNVVAAMLIIWFIYYIENRKLIYSALFLTLILLTKEIMAVWMCFVIVGLMIKNYTIYHKQYLTFEIPALIFCVLYAVIIIGFVIPYMQNSEHNLQLGRYMHIGNSFSDILVNLITNPRLLISLLFENILVDTAYDGIKLELHYFVLVSGGVALFIRPAYFIMLIPIYAQKLFASDYNLWGINYHYSIEFVPILSLAVVDVIASLKKYKLTITLLIAFITFGFTLKSMDSRQSKWYNAQNTRFYQAQHYSAELNLNYIYTALQLIDKEAPLSASSVLTPHLASRDKIYLFPIIKDAQYIALITDKRSTYPLTNEEFIQTVNQYKESETFDIIYDEHNLLIFKKR